MARTTKHLKKKLWAWTGGKSLLFSMHAIQAVFACKTFANLVASESGKTVRQSFVGRTDSAWGRYYGSLLEWACELSCPALQGAHSIDEDTLRFAAALQSKNKEAIELFSQLVADPELRDLWAESLREGKRTGELELERTINDAVSGGPEKLSEETYEQERRLPAESFLARVAAPCVIRYGKLPQELFKDATNEENPDLDALNQLVDLDREIVHLPEVRAILEDADQQVTAARYSTGAATLVKPSSPPTLVEVKRGVAGFVWQLGKFLGEKVTAPEIQKLFDLAAKHSNPSLLADPDFAELEPDSFRRMMTRKGKCWESVLADKRIAKAVRALRSKAA